MIEACPTCGEMVRQVGLVMPFNLDDGSVHVHWENWTITSAQ